MEFKSASGIYPFKLALNMLANQASILQIGIFAIEQLVRIFETINMPSFKLIIFVKSRAAIKALGYHLIKSEHARNYKKSLRCIVEGGVV